jgi:hypothetical protein
MLERLRRNLALKAYMERLGPPWQKINVREGKV